MKNTPPSIGTRFVVALLAISAVIGVFFVMQHRLIPESSTVEELNREISRLKNANVSLSRRIDQLEVRIGSLEKEGAAR